MVFFNKFQIIHFSITLILLVFFIYFEATKFKSFLRISDDAILLRPNTLDDEEVSSVILSGSRNPTALKGGTISVYGSKATPKNTSYASDVHIFSGGNKKDGFGQVWIGVTLDHPVLGVVPQDVIGLQNDQSVDIFSFNGLRIHPDKNDLNQQVVVTNDKSSPSVSIIGKDKEEINFGINGKEAYIDGDVDNLSFEVDLIMKNDLVIMKSARVGLKGNTSTGKNNSHNNERSCKVAGQIRNSGDSLWFCNDKLLWMKIMLGSE